MIFTICLVFFLCAIIALIPSESITTKYLFFISIALIMILVTGFRNGDYVRDYSIYADIYERNSDDITEPAFIFISYILHIISSDNPIYLFVLFATLGVSLKFVAIRQLTELWFLSIVIYCSYLFVLHEMTQIRAGIASAFLLLCIKPIYENDLKRFLLFAFLAFSFHYSAIVFFPLWFLGHNPQKKWLSISIPLGYVAYFLHLNIIYALPIPGIEEKIELYKKIKELDGEVWDVINVFNPLILARIMFFYFILWKYDLIISHNKYFTILIKIYCFSLVSIFMFSVLPVVAFRISELLSSVEIILIPLLFYTIKERIISKIIVIIIGSAFLCILLFYNKIVL